MRMNRDYRYYLMHSRRSGLLLQLGGINFVNQILASKFRQPI